MHLSSCLTLLSALLVCSNAVAIPPQAQDPNPAPAAAQPVPKLTLQPANISINQSVNFDLDGNVNHSDAQMSINIYCFYNAEIPPLSYHDLSLDKVVTTSGEELKVDPNRMNRGHQRIWTNHHRDGNPYFQIYFNLPAPRQPARGIREIKGQLIMELPDGPLRQVRLSPVSDYMGKRASIIDMDRRELSLAADQQEGRFQIRFDRAVEPLIQEISFVKSDGSPLRIDDNGSGSSSNMSYRRFRGKLPDDAAVVIKLYKQTREVTVPFVLNDLMLPGQAEPDRALEVAVATEPVDAAAPQQGGPEPLRVELVGDVVAE